MDQLVTVLNEIITWGQIIGASFLGVAVLFLGFQAIWGGREGMQVVKKVAPAIMLGAVLIFGAVGIAAAIRGLIPSG